MSSTAFGVFDTPSKQLDELVMYPHIELCTVQDLSITVPCAGGRGAPTWTNKKSLLATDYLFLVNFFGGVAHSTDPMHFHIWQGKLVFAVSVPAEVFQELYCAGFLH